MGAALFQATVDKPAPEFFGAIKFWRSLVCAVCLNTLACAVGADEQNPLELVFRKSAKIEVRLDGKSISIEAIGELQRRIYINECSYDVVLRPRQTRWYGNLGGYNPGFSWQTTNNCAGLSRVVITEGQIHFKDKEFAREWLSRQPKSYNIAYDRQGLVISWGIDLERSQIGIIINLMCLNGVNYNAHNTNGIINFGEDSAQKYIHDCKYVPKEEIKKIEIFLRNQWDKYKIK